MICRTLTAICALALLPACEHFAQTAPDASLLRGLTASGAPVRADILGSEGGQIGSAVLRQGPNGVLIRVTLEAGALTPGWHGLHLHQVGDCSDTGTYKLSGGHVGKIEGGHGLLNPDGPEGGDTPNIYAAADGSAAMEIVTNLTNLETLTDEDGSALIIHAGEDDHITQPIGGAGARVACAVIER